MEFMELNGQYEPAGQLIGGEEGLKDEQKNPAGQGTQEILRTTLLINSAVNKSPVLRLVDKHSPRLNCARRPKPFVVPAIPFPAIVETYVVAKWMARKTFPPSSMTYKKVPRESRVIPRGDLNEALVPVPSTEAVVAVHPAYVPASVVTLLVVVCTVRIKLLYISATNKRPLKW